ncbi:unnamed protein product [Brugia pahangi]|uniref:RDD family protein n=1 Tax=Brugia pahangi TaxID=6280 RepID=A0A0N4TB33_BRUPA|nr:unnamed protein product [Brugia pahangi]
MIVIAAFIFTVYGLHFRRLRKVNGVVICVRSSLVHKLRFQQ